MELAFKESADLEKIYWARENFHHILDNNSCVQQTLLAIEKWTQDLITKGIKAFDGFIKTLAKTKIYVANYVLNNISNAVTEGLNNLIRSVRRTAFGMPKFENIRLRVLPISQ